MATAASSPDTTLRDMELSRSHAASFGACPAQLPCSFLYGGEQVRGIPRSGSRSPRPAPLMRTWWRRSTRARTRSTGLSIRAEVLEYRDFPVIEWTVWLTNTGTEPTPS